MLNTTNKTMKRKLSVDISKLKTWQTIKNKGFLGKDSSEPNELIHLNKRMIYVSMALRPVNDHKFLDITGGHIKR